MANFFIDKSMINETYAEIGGEEFKHIKTVLRMRPGEEITLCDGEGMFYDAVLTGLGDKIALADILKSYPAPTEPKLKITLFQGIPKNPKLELIIQKATEIGVVKIVPMNTSRIVAKLDKEAKIDRLRKIALEAAKQSRRGIVPEVAAPVSFTEAVEMAAKCDLAMIPYEDEHSVSIKQRLSGSKARSLAIMIGPEGGFEAEEVAFAAQHGVLSATLGPRILRTETAGLAAAAVALYELGEME